MQNKAAQVLNNVRYWISVTPLSWLVLVASVFPVAIPGAGLSPLKPSWLFYFLFVLFDAFL